MLDFSKNYFELFGLPVKFAIDREELAVRYRDLQKAMHPDRFANATEQEKRLSMQGASRVNDAFETLKDPLLRVSYILEQKGVDVAAASANTQDATFLMEQMELREELEAAKGKPDPYAAVADLMSHIEERIQAYLDEIERRLESSTPDCLEQALAGLQKLKFMYKLRSQTEELEAELDDML